MKFHALLSLRLLPKLGHRLVIGLAAVEEDLQLEVPSGSGPFNRLMTDHLRAAERRSAIDCVYASSSESYALQSIELDEVDIANLIHFQTGGCYVHPRQMRRVPEQGSFQWTW